MIADLKTKKEVFAFLIGLFTSSETLMIARRIQIAKLLIQGKDYEFIRKELKVSFQTINKIEHWLKGDKEKNRLIFKKLKKYVREEKRYEPPKLSGSMLDRYAHHNVIKNIIG